MLCTLVPYRRSVGVRVPRPELRVTPQHVVAHGVGDRGGHLRPARVLHQHPRVAVAVAVAFASVFSFGVVFVERRERGELGADLAEGERPPRQRRMRRCTRGGGRWRGSGGRGRGCGALGRRAGVERVERGCCFARRCLVSSATRCTSRANDSWRSSLRTSTGRKRALLPRRRRTARPRDGNEHLRDRERSLRGVVVV